MAMTKTVDTLERILDTEPVDEPAVIEDYSNELEAVHRALAQWRRSGVYQHINNLQYTPKHARAYLSIAGENRNDRPYWIRKLSKDMKENRWHRRVDQLIIDENGKFRGGFHTTKAVILSEKTIEVDVIVGVDEATVKSSGTAQPWGIADYLKSLPDIKTKERLAKLEMSFIPDKGFTSGRDLTSDEVMEWILENDEEVSKDILAMPKLDGIKNMPDALALMIYRILKNHEPDHVLPFLIEMYRGIGCEEGPVLQARRFFSDATAGRQTLKGASSMANNNRLKVVYRAWNKWARGETGALRMTGELPELKSFRRVH